MSRIGKRPVPLPSGVTATTEGQILSVKGPKGSLSLQMRDEISYAISEDGISVQPANETKQARAFWGMQRTLVQNLVVLDRIDHVVEHRHGQGALRALDHQQPVFVGRRDAARNGDRLLANAGH